MKNIRCIALSVLAAGLAVSTGQARTVCTAIADSETGRIIEQKGECSERATPASTFKIAISLMGFDSQFLKDENSPALPFQQGYPDWMPAWRQTTDPSNWIKYSVVWFSQQVTQFLGEERFRDYIKEFKYGNQDISGNPGKHDGLTQSWLSSSLKISPLEQLVFLEDVVNRRLPLTAHAFDMTSRITHIIVLPNGWEIHGKTGTGAPQSPDGSYDRAHAYGWFVGWATAMTVVFARLIQDEKEETDPAGPRARSAFLDELPSILDSLTVR